LRKFIVIQFEIYTFSETKLCLRLRKTGSSTNHITTFLQDTTNQCHSHLYKAIWIHSLTGAARGSCLQFTVLHACFRYVREKTFTELSRKAPDKQKATRYILVYMFLATPNFHLRKFTSEKAKKNLNHNTKYYLKTRNLITFNDLINFITYQYLIYLLTHLKPNNCLHTISLQNFKKTESYLLHHMCLFRDIQCNTRPTTSLQIQFNIILSFTCSSPTLITNTVLSTAGVITNRLH
jgi:hypothetical protein